jgi:hypothetical protein
MPKAAKTKTSEGAGPGTRLNYYLLDKDMEYINGRALTAEEKKTRQVRLTASEAMAYTASGSISTEDPNKTKEVSKAVAAGADKPGA